jgi:hypothetical protein
MEREKIRFENKSFMARVEGRGNNKIECTPVVYDDPFDCGVGVYFNDGKDEGLVWGMMSPRNLIAAWRATEVLRRLDNIESGTLCDAFYTGVRDPHSSDMESHVKPTIAKIGQKAYKEIMSLPVPEQIIRAITDNQGEDFPPSRYPVTEEVRAGTIKWRQEFATVGIEHPDEVDVKEREQKMIIEKFDILLSRYAKEHGRSRRCVGMLEIEGILIDLVKRGAHQKNSDLVLVSLAIAVGHVLSYESTLKLMPSLKCIFKSQEEYDSWIEKKKKEGVSEASIWLVSQSNYPSLFFWRKKQDSFTLDSAKKLLSALFEMYFPPPPRKKAEIVSAQ